MARILDQFVSEPRECSYLPSEIAALEYRLIVDMEPEEWESMLERGWRRFGVAYFRPACAVCAQCVPLRVPVAEFKPTRNQRRVLNRGADIRLAIGVPKVDDTRLALYHAWHDQQGEARGWSPDRMSLERYFHEFAFPHPSVREFSYYDGDRLVAVGLVDETPSALSAIYTYYDPEEARRSLGTLSVLRQVDVARRAGKRWLYLGYRVMGCVSSEYKARYRPHELLVGYPGPNVTPVWRRAER